jgi:Na+-transporting NADH:ubiquinone oxidoreductase subunit NqrB
MIGLTFNNIEEYAIVAMKFDLTRENPMWYKIYGNVLVLLGEYVIFCCFIGVFLIYLKADSWWRRYKREVISTRFFYA